MSLAERLEARIEFTGEVPFGSCVFQATGNILAAHHVGAPMDVVCTSWGFSWDGRRGGLGGSGRWIGYLSALTGLDVSEQEFSSWEESISREKELTSDGWPVIASLDSFFIPSPYEGREHLGHAVIVLRHTDKNVTVVDPMNAPRPRDVSLKQYRQARSDGCVPNFHMIACCGRLRNHTTVDQALGQLCQDLISHWDQDASVAASYSAALRSGLMPLVDVSEVAGERTYAARLVRRAASDISVFAPNADAVEALARRWYFVHALTRQRDQQTSPAELAAFVNTLFEDDKRVRDDLIRSAGVWIDL